MKKKSSRITEELLETAKGMHKVGIFDDKAYEKITIRLLKKENKQNVKPITGDEICAMREEAHLSQAAFAWHLNLTKDYISKLERGEKHPTGAILTLLNVIRRRGFKAIL